MTSRDVDYCLMRARQEAHKACTTHCPEAAAVHRTLSMRYATRALLLGAGEMETPTFVERRVSA